MSTFGLIPARGGSKGIPRKNVRPIAGKPLIAWTIEAALQSTRLSSVLVSTDDAEIAQVALAYGAKVLDRPSELARDDSPGIAPVLHAIDAMPSYSAVLLLQPTSPLRSVGDIDACLALADREQARSIVSVSEPDAHPQWTYRITGDGHLAPVLESPQFSRRQDLPSVYTLNGALYYAEVNWLRQRASLLAPETLAYVMPRERSVDIDGPLDWKLAEILLKERFYS